MAGAHRISSSLFIQSGSVATFKNGIALTGSISSSINVSGSFLGDGSKLTNLNFNIENFQLFVGSASGVPPTFGQWSTGSGGNHSILLTASSSNIIFNHFTFLRNSNGRWIEVSDYTGQQNGLQSNNTFSETLGTGVYRYLLLAMSTASLKTAVEGTTVIINPGSL